MKTFVVDVDNTLSPFEYPAYQECLKINPDFPAPDKWDRWEIFTHCGLTIDQMHVITDAVHARQMEHEPLPGARELLTYLCRKGLVVVASHRSQEMWEILYDWLIAKKLPFHKIHVSWDKSVLLPYASVIIDDNPHMLKKAEEAGVRAMALRWPWNVEAGYGELYDNLGEILEALKKEEWGYEPLG